MTEPHLSHSVGSIADVKEITYKVEIHSVYHDEKMSKDESSKSDESNNIIPK